ncbi:MAG: DNA/RNA non-specific endonuclease [Bacteroidales bacterium]|nr:DNA/RNA non-specific endonuclease [Bacteroidales bacterium]
MTSPFDFIKKTLLVLFIGLSFSGYSQNVTLKYKKFTSIYDTKRHIPFYTYYTLTKAQAKNFKQFKRLSTFSKDLSCKYEQADNKDYLHGGYDKGHLTPAADMSYDQTAEMQCFYFTNIVPQNSKLNRGQWKALEEYVRNKTLNTDSVLIITGAFSFTKGIKLNNIFVPDSLFKIIYNYKTGKIETYIMPNKEVGNYMAYLSTRSIIANVDFKKIILQLKKHK